MKDIVLHLDISSFLEVFESVCINRKNVSVETFDEIKSVLLHKWSDLKEIERKEKMKCWIDEQKRKLDKKSDDIHT